MAKLLFRLLWLILFSGIAYADVLPKYSYSEVYIYDNQDIDSNMENNMSDGTIKDPFIVLNKHVFNINYFIDSAILSPIAETYIAVIPDRGRARVGNFVSNLGEPINFVNLILQGKFDKARISLGRFMTNTVLGCAGIMDVATALNLKYNGEDFGQTLAHYSVPSGPYLVAPIIGPTSVRDISGKIVDFFIDPFKYSLNKPERNTVSALNMLHKRSSVNQVIKTINNSLDPYETSKVLYTQNRASSINN